jgi:hypothetical protein
VYCIIFRAHHQKIVSRKSLHKENCLKIRFFNVSCFKSSGVCDDGHSLFDERRLLLARGEFELCAEEDVLPARVKVDGQGHGVLYGGGGGHLLMLIVLLQPPQPDRVQVGDDDVAFFDVDPKIKHKQDVKLCLVSSVELGPASRSDVSSFSTRGST